MRRALESVGLLRRFKGLLRGSMRYPTYSKGVARRIARTTDRVRFGSLALAIESIQRDDVPGALAELGVWRGVTSSFVHSQLPRRPLYLFDTFAGFPGSDGVDDRFRDTSVELVRRKIGDCSNVIFRVGNFPETTSGLESEVFAFVLLDADKYEPTLAGLDFFYPRVPRGGYIFLHDYNSPDLEPGVSRAVGHFLKDKPEQIIEIPDVWGSAVFRKI
jgi:O-methyltransferase